METLYRRKSCLETTKQILKNTSWSLRSESRHRPTRLDLLLQFWRYCDMDSVLSVIFVILDRERLRKTKTTIRFSAVFVIFGTENGMVNRIRSASTINRKHAGSDLLLFAGTGLNMCACTKNINRNCIKWLCIIMSLKHWQPAATPHLT